MQSVCVPTASVLRGLDCHVCLNLHAGFVWYACRYNLSQGFVGQTQSLTSAVSKEKATLLKDNQSVYVEVVPNTQTLGPIAKVNAESCIKVLTCAIAG